MIIDFWLVVGIWNVRDKNSEQLHFALPGFPNGKNV
jgi:hypothetical protein